MKNKLPKFSVYVIFDENEEYLKTVSTVEQKDKELAGSKKAKYFMELRVNEQWGDYLKQTQKHVTLDVEAKIRVEMYVDETDDDKIEEYLRYLADNKYPDLTDGEIKELDFKILYIEQSRYYDNSCSVR